MGAKFYEDDNGNYLGSFDDHGDTNEQNPFIDETEISGPPAPTVNQVKAEANKRIEAVLPMWMVAREVSGGDAISTDIQTFAADIRADCVTLEGTLPDDYTDDSHWHIYVPA